MSTSVPSPERQLGDALEADDLEAVESIVVARLYDLFIADWPALVSAIDRLPAESLERHPELQVISDFYSGVMLADGAINREVVPVLLADSAEIVQGSDWLRHWILVQELVAYRLRAEFARAREVGEVLRVEVTRPDRKGRRPMHELAPFAMLQIGLAELLDGHPGQALRDFDEARILRPPHKLDVVGRDSLMKTALVQAAHGDLNVAEASLRRAERVPSPSVSFRQFSDVSRAMTEALIAVERLDPRADELVAAALETGADDELWAFAFLAAGRQATANGDFTRMLDLVHHASLHKPMPAGSLLALSVASAHARALLLLGEYEAAAEIIEAARDDRGRLRALAPARIRLALHVDGPEAALALARSFVITPDLGPGARAETMLLMAWAQQWAHGAADPATTRPLGRLIAREGLWRILQLVPAEVVTAIPGIETAPVIARHRSLPDAGRRQGVRLTPTEMEVLRLLVTPDSLPAIARARFVTLNTVKSQVASVYRRLGVHSRREAVAEAHRRRLFD